MAAAKPEPVTEALPGHLRHATCWVALLLLTGLTFGMSHVSLGRWSLVVSLGIAAAKVSVVAIIFMNLREHPGAPRLVLGGAALFVAVLAGLVVGDVMTRPVSLP